ncbi:hypothetical protein NKH82_04445 [Mesorhizobium sp. M0915]|uniref:hypothetical protein n=1 Tax=Mesorhizobium sp. M0915 TaxID=2957027 RepID=UPI00333C3693
MATDKTQQVADRLGNALSADVPKVYANGFALSMSNSDIILVLELNGVAQTIVNLSFTTAKTLSVKLGGTIGVLETASGRPMLITDEVEKFLGLSQEEPK